MLYFNPICSDHVPIAEESQRFVKKKKKKKKKKAFIRAEVAHGAGA